LKNRTKEGGNKRNDCPKPRKKEIGRPRTVASVQTHQMEKITPRHITGGREKRIVQIEKKNGGKIKIRKFLKPPEEHTFKSREGT